MTKAHRDGIRGTGLTQAAARPFRPYVYRGGDIEPPEVTAARERYRAHTAALDALAAGRTCGGEVTPDAAPGYEWKRELDDEDELAERGAAAEARQAAAVAAQITERGRTPQQRYDLRRLFDYGEGRQAAPAAVPEPGPLPAPPPVTAASRCGRCGYLTTATGHKVTCDD